MEKKWQVKPIVDQKIIEQFPEVNSVVLQLLANREIVTQQAMDDFLAPNYDRDVLDPFLFKQMDLAVKRIFTAIHNREKVLVYGDYDADGVCSSSIIFLALKGLGLEVEVYIPFRETEGYGMNKNVVKTIIAQNFSLVVTVDCGISNHEEIAELKAAGIDTVVTDHHQDPLVRPEAVAIINSSLADSGYPFNSLCGAGVAFKLVQALMIYQEKDNSPIKLPIGFDKWLLDLVAIATVGDIVPLLGENRVLVKYGLVVLEKTKRLGIKTLIDQIVTNYDQKIDTQFIGWRLVPRLNATGRLHHASVSFDLLTNDDPLVIAKLATNLDESNKKRQQMTEKALKESLEQLGEVSDDQKILWVVSENWQHGIIGLVAGRLTDRFHRPALAFTKDGDKYVASGRSVEEFNITSALKECQEFLTRFGGHSQACGLTIIGEENLLKFKEKISAIASEKLAGIELKSAIEIEVEVKLSEINWELWDSLEKFEPFGEANPKPLFLAKAIRIEKVQTVGNDGKHLKVVASQDDLPNFHKLIGFSFGDWCAKLNIGDKIDLVFDLDVNEWNGNRELQLKIIDLKLSE